MSSWRPSLGFRSSSSSHRLWRPPRRAPVSLRAGRRPRLRRGADHEPLAVPIEEVNAFQASLQGPRRTCAGSCGCVRRRARLRARPRAVAGARGSSPGAVLGGLLLVVALVGGGRGLGAALFLARCDDVARRGGRRAVGRRGSRRSWPCCSCCAASCRRGRSTSGSGSEAEPTLVRRRGTAGGDARGSPGRGSRRSSWALSAVGPGHGLGWTVLGRSRGARRRGHGDLGRTPLATRGVLFGLAVIGSGGLGAGPPSFRIVRRRGDAACRGRARGSPRAAPAPTLRS